jgi:hypothetical protein
MKRRPSSASNAGQNPPLVFRDKTGEVKELDQPQFEEIPGTIVRVNENFSLFNKTSRPQGTGTDAPSPKAAESCQISRVRHICYRET